ncbi:hypothetical protein AHEV_094 [Adoxophyes honmai entomopoxvirus 'L']|uniref:Uncharacterized protein n=1 Tax=Adoxophyes honmai entomopoxvirus 'L' TaxID=1293540 RepID=A0A916KP20_9POXV|nr:hypothetical protein AHEV_094 [Adoxophyes honmai entomopoxvirus 'L']CCU55415.1 hypothetical protein AHEV_094 [Adoxophyes honmai entomopoxvirus 'L']
MKKYIEFNIMLIMEQLYNYMAITEKSLENSLSFKNNYELYEKQKIKYNLYILQINNKNKYLIAYMLDTIIIEDIPDVISIKFFKKNVNYNNYMNMLDEFKCYNLMKNGIFFKTSNIYNISDCIRIINNLIKLY